MLILQPRYLVPVRPRGVVLEDHALVVDPGSGIIVALLTAQHARDRYPDAEWLSLARHVLMPGLINMHTHSPMTLLRGFADDLRLDEWLQEHIWPAEQRWVDADFVRAGTELAIAEMVKSGTTCFNENYFFPDVMAEAADRAGLRATIGIPVIDIETSFASSGAEYIEKGMAIAQDYALHPRVQFSFAPHSTYSVSEELMRDIVRHSDRHDMKVHMHLLEIAWEIKHARRETGLTPVQYVHELGLLDERLIAVHMVHLDEQDIDALAQSGTHVVHCPHSNLKLGSGICPASELVSRGVNVSIGTDGVAANNTLSMFDEMRTAALLAKGVGQDPRTLDATTMLDLVTVNAARALGLGHQLGTLEPGKQADLCAIDLADPRTQPVHHVISQLVYAAPGAQVSDVWVAGNRLLEDGRLITLDEAAVLERAAEWAERMRTEH